ncbi:MAG: phospholipase D-like domain-containing protein [bacterium]|nr:phospholipase D-like domain-containing protein [bacterium]
MKSYRWLPVLAALLFVILVIGCSNGDGGVDPPPPGGNGLNPEQLAPEVQVQIVDMRYRTPTNTDEPLNSDPIPGIIASARSSLDIAMPRINRQEIVNQLLSAASRGVQVRIVTEKGYFDDNEYTPFYAQLQDPARNGGNLQIRTDLEGLPRQMHSRFIIVDNSRVVTGSYTWESADFNRTIGDVVSILSTAVAQAFLSQFNQMFSEAHFGNQKVDNIQHTFALGGGQAILEVYFGPVDSLRSHIQDEIESSGNTRIAIQQFNDLGMANFLGQWIASNSNRHLELIINNVRGAATDTNDNLVYNFFRDYTRNPADGSGRLVLSGMAVETGPITDILEPYVNFTTMNEKLIFADHALTDNIPAVMTTTANFTAQGLDQNDEVLLILRGAPLVNKYIRGPYRDENGLNRWGINHQSVLPPASLRNAVDLQELDQLALMFPYISSDATDSFRQFSQFPSALIVGEISNFRRRISIQTAEGESEELEIDAQMLIYGTTFSGQTIAEDEAVPLGDTTTGEGFVENENLNPDHRFMQVLPAGTWTLQTVVLVDGEADSRFTPTETRFTIGPGGVRQLTLTINQAVNIDTGSGGGGQV